MSEIRLLLVRRGRIRLRFDPKTRRDQGYSGLVILILTKGTYEPVGPKWLAQTTTRRFTFEDVRVNADGETSISGMTL